MAPIQGWGGGWRPRPVNRGGTPPPPGDNGTPPGGGTVPGGRPPSDTGAYGAGNNNPPPGGGSNPWASNFGQAMNPWNMPYQGQFTAPMSPWESNAMTGYGNFVQGGQGLGGASNYINDVLGGKYLNLNSNPWLQQIQTGMQGTKDYQDAQNLRRIQSAMAAGGNALSGANAGAQSDYLGQSDSAFQTLMGNLMNQNYGMERGFMNQAPGQLGQIAGQTGAGYGQMFNMGGVPRNIQQQDLNRQYEDFLRQTGNMREDYRYPDTLTSQLLYGGGYRNQTPNQYGNSIMDMILGQLGRSGGEGGIDWASMIQSLGDVDWGSIFGGGGGGESAADGVRLGYDAGTVRGPVGYGDTDWYSKALTAAQAQNATQRNAAAHPPTNTTAGIVMLLLQALRAYSGSKKKKAGTKVGAGAGGGKGQDSKPGEKKPGQTGPTANPSMYPQPIGPNPYDPSSFMSGYGSESPYRTFDENAWNDLIGEYFGGSGYDPSFGGYNPENFAPEGGFDPNAWGGGGNEFEGFNPENFGPGAGGLGDFGGDGGGGGGEFDFGGFNPENFGGGFGDEGGGGGWDF